MVCGAHVRRAGAGAEAATELGGPREPARNRVWGRRMCVCVCVVVVVVVGGGGRGRACACACERDGASSPGCGRWLGWAAAAGGARRKGGGGGTYCVRALVCVCMCVCACA